MPTRLLTTALASALLAGASLAQQPQQPPAVPLTRDEIAVLARAQVAVGIAHDSIDAELAKPRNKTPEAQQQLRDKLRAQIAEILHHAGLTQEDYDRRTYVVSTDPPARKTFDSVVVALTGAPIPGQYVAPPGQGGRGSVPVPAGPVGLHVGHVVNSFGDTPNAMGLLPAAIAEAKIAVTHAQLAARQPTNLEYMKMHAGHVINAIDPTVVAAGPGLKYGVKKAAQGVVTHIELAAAAPGASPNVVMHARHVATSARNTIQRSDELVAIAQKIMAATSAEVAASLVSQMSSLAEQLMAGADKNADGKITWEAGEGGLQQADEHMKLMLAGEK
jgi:hypothetical protein